MTTRLVRPLLQAGCLVDAAIEVNAPTALAGVPTHLTPHIGAGLSRVFLLYSGEWVWRLDHIVPPVLVLLVAGLVSVRVISYAVNNDGWPE